MKTTNHTDGWWIEGVPTYHVDGEPFTSCGPYRTKAEAEDDRHGLERHYRSEVSRRRDSVSVTTTKQGMLF